MSVTAQYNGDFFDPRDTKNKISLSVLQSRMENALYSKTDNDVFTNIFTFNIK